VRFWTRRTADRIHSLERKLAAFADQLDAVKSRYDVPESLVAEYEAARVSDEYRSVFDKKSPLVSVCVATYHKPTELIDRCVRSLVEQTYENLEIIVIGDCCTDDTDERMAAEVKDSRVRYENLRTRTPYPLDPELRWMVAGTPAMNRALELVRGDFVTHLDHDDEHDRKRLERLVPLIQETRADLVFHPFYYQRQRGDWKLKEARAFGPAQVTTSSVLYHRWFARVRWDLDSYRFREPGDWGRLRRIAHLGARLVRHPEPLLRHYMEKLAQRP
jgi:glycosyltransferase involved in cell wall biosynthesis